MTYLRTKLRIMQLKGVFQEKGYYHQFLILVMLVLLSTGFFMVLWFMSLPGIFGIDTIKNPAAISEYNNPEVIRAISTWQVIQAFATFIIPAFLMAWLTSTEKPTQYLVLDTKPNIKALLVAGLIMFAALPFINWMGFVNSKMSLPDSMHWMEEWMKNAEDQAALLTKSFLSITSVGDLLFKIIMMALLPAIGEELLFRGVVQRLFYRWLNNIHIAVILSAVLFSAMHMQFFGFIPRMAMGVALGYMFAFTGSIWVPIFAHFVNNASVVIFTYAGWTAADTLGAEPNDLLITLASMVTTILLMYVLSTKFKSRASIE